MEEGRSAFKIVTGKPTGKRPLWRPWRIWEDNIRIDLEEIVINAGNWNQFTFIFHRRPSWDDGGK